MADYTINPQQDNEPQNMYPNDNANHPDNNQEDDIRTESNERDNLDGAPLDQD